LAYYPPGMSQDSHEHDQPHLSLVLAGEFAEQIGSRTLDRHFGQGMRRAAGARHAVAFGRAGALLLNIEEDDCVASDGFADWIEGPATQACFDNADGPAPSWLLSARERLLEAPGRTTIQDLAGQCGVHRVHFSRMFAYHFGLRPSVFRIRSMASRALMLTLTQDLSLAEGALEAGFADQAHLTRAVKSSCGLPLGALRTLLS
jgi:AraC family transcriptional regulator